MKIKISVAIFALCVGVFVQTQTAFSYYQCISSYSGQTYYSFNQCPEDSGDSQRKSNGCRVSEYWDGVQCKEYRYCTLQYPSTCDSSPCALGYHHVTPGDDRCVLDYPYTPVNPVPVQYCEINRSYFYNFSQTPCVCPPGSSKFFETSYGYTGGQSFTCVSHYTPQPAPTPIYCWDGSTAYNSNSCPSYKYCSNDGRKYPLSHTCYVPPVVYQVCWNGSVIPTTSACPIKPVCTYFQYWNGYACIDYYYQPYYPIIQYPDYNNWMYYDWNME